MIGVVDVGGGLCAVYGAGIFDYCLDAGLAFDYGIGVSAGSANIASYQAHQKGRNLPYYRDYPLRSEYFGVKALFRSHSLLDLDYIYGTLSNEGGENPLDYDAMMENPAVFRIVATDAETGKPIYFDKSRIERNNYRILNASSCLPVLCRPVKIDGHAYLDGGVADPIPLKKAFADGCDRLVVILTRPAGQPRTPGAEEKLVKPLSLRYPEAAEMLASRYIRYNNEVALLKRYQAQGRVLVLSPDDCCGVDTLTREPEKISRLYEKGYADGAKLTAFFGCAPTSPRPGA